MKKVSKKKKDRKIPYEKRIRKVHTKKVIPLTLVLLLIIIFGSLLVLNIREQQLSVTAIIGIRSETLYFILAFALLLVIILFVMDIIYFEQGHKFKRMNKNHEGIKASGVVNSEYESMKLVASGAIIDAENSNLGEGELKLGEEDSKVLMNSIYDFSKNGTQGLPIIGNGLALPQEEKEEEEEEIEEDLDTRFYMLTKIDEKYENTPRLNYEDDIDLENLCNDFREYACNKLKLFYDIRDIRRFITSLAVSHTMILQGMSGTGKTSLAYAFGEYIKNSSTVVPIQPMWKERTDMLGYYNEFTKKFNETTLLNKIYEANYNDKIYITVLDEMNIARVEYYFAEFLSLLELPNPDSRYLDVVTDKWETDPKLLRNGQVKLPNNMWFIGTANNDDSTFAISDKVYDRAMIINLDTKSNAFDGKETQPRMLSASRFSELTTEAKSKYKITRRNLDRIKKLDSYMIKTFHITFGNRIMKQIKEYVPVFIACGGDELEAIDDLLSRKVMRKLESQNPVYVRKVSQELINCLDDIFGFDKMKLCKEYIELLSRVS